jgi:hypothetical protein
MRAQRCRTAAELNLAGRLVGIVLGLAAGGFAGFALGGRFRGRPRAYWTMNVVAVLGCAALDYAGLASGRYWLAYSAVGLMGGMITGLKYGYSDSIAMRPSPNAADAPTGDAADASEDSLSTSPDESGDSPR